MTEIPLTEFMNQRTADTVLVDVREQDEYEEAHIPGVVHIPLGQLSARTAEIPQPSGDDPIYVVCRSGKRSLQGAQVLSQAGLPAVSVMEGTLGWIEAGGEVRTGSQR
ncbi:rhodanese-like domain-containing protein [Gephyromycinifex aptenodytis]|uniref:rhodanese-like domain-containing protein n=1 Tax=Gephyromycinifex aptenodytis TaxID=2716227 RepID=UPI00144815E4|nr:rhodanese-like domain-containing protein [Gephyromycinifex aptenodytis]